jgi:hypothetical protein
MAVKRGAILGQMWPQAEVVDEPRLFLLPGAPAVGASRDHYRIAPPARQRGPLKPRLARTTTAAAHFGHPIVLSVVPS